MRWLALLSLIAVLALPFATAAESPPDSRVGASAVQHAQEIVVEDSVLRPAELFQDTPVETEILTREDLRRLPAQTLDEALAFLPGIRIQSRIQGQAAAVSIEGMPPSYTMVLVNGQRYSGEFGGVDDVRDIPLSNIERIEIQRGAQGLRFGPEAGGGVIDIITVPPVRSGARFDGQAGGGSDEFAWFDATPSAGNETVGANVSYVYGHEAGFHDPKDLEGYTPIPFSEDSTRQDHDVYGTFRWNPLDSLAANTRFGWRKTDEDLVSEASGDRAKRSYERWLVTQDWGWDFASASRFSGALTYMFGDTESDVGRRFDMEEDEVKLEGALDQFVEFWGVGANLALGGDIRRTTLDLDQDDFVSPADPDLVIESDIDEEVWHGGVYLLAEAEVSTWLVVETGARYQMREGIGPELLPHGALMLTPWRSDDGRSFKLRFSAGRNFRIPTLRELYQPPVAQLGGAYFLEGNPDLEAEEAISYRVGIETNPVRWLSLSATGFYNEIENHIRSSYAGSIVTGFEEVPPDTSPGSDCDLFGDIFPELCETIFLPIPAAVYRKDNLDDVTTRGIELRLHLRPHRVVDAQLGYTFLDTHVDDSNVDIRELPNEPRHVIDGRLSLTAPVLDTQLTVRVRWRDEALIETSGTGLLGFTTDRDSDPSTTVDLRVSQPFLDHWALYFDVQNATDNRFVDSYVVRGRTFRGGLRVRFP